MLDPNYCASISSLLYSFVLEMTTLYFLNKNLFYSRYNSWLTLALPVIFVLYLEITITWVMNYIKGNKQYQRNS
jgi:hypothetical protein